ncbi:pyridoxamine 5'-phosphate oxidase [Candidatus Palauibacter sp.]|uniref:pyridoxamine 5'-phosphate oxidase n=1 Tax=Candidatus Palauibacter sp. TaxID=3101350 RepID=UPI003B5AB582
MSKFDDLRAHLRAIRTLTRGVTSGLPTLAAASDPLELFRRWLEDAEASGLLLPESMTLATATAGGRPSARMVLLKGADPDGLRFFTNFGSRKAAELDANPWAALCFHWSVLERQVRVEGSVERLSQEDAAEYFATRGRGSQIGAWASEQSRPIADRAGLEARAAEIEARFAGKEVPLPDFWGGYLLVPERFEFWQGRANRLHDRLVYTPRNGEWEITRLQP